MICIHERGSLKVRSLSLCLWFRQKIHAHNALSYGFGIKLCSNLVISFHERSSFKVSYLSLCFLHFYMILELSFAAKDFLSKKTPDQSKS